jgi:hypothetical protein
MQTKYLGVIVCAAVVGGALRAEASPIEVGSGVNDAALVIQFSDGALYEFDVNFGLTAADTTTGLGLFDIVEAATDLTTVRQTFGSSVFIDGIAFDGHNDSGFGGGDNWWHFWIRDAGEIGWTTTVASADDQIVEDGDANGWVYGSAGAPVPEPTTLALLAGFSLVLHKGSKR